jgi:hypothetical protein
MTGLVVGVDLRSLALIVRTDSGTTVRVSIADQQIKRTAADVETTWRVGDRVATNARGYPLRIAMKQVLETK